MGLHLYIAQVDYERGYGVVSLCYEDIWIYTCMIWIVAKSGFPCYKLMNMNISLSMSLDYGWGQGMVCMMLVTQKWYLVLDRIMGSYLCIAQVEIKVAYVIVLLWWDDLGMWLCAWTMSCKDWDVYYVYVRDYACYYDDILYAMMNYN